MQTVSTIGFDIAKSVFQVHGVDANGLVVIRRQLKRRYVLAFFEKLPSGSNAWRARNGLIVRPLIRFVGAFTTASDCRVDKISRSAASQCCSASPSRWPFATHIS
jgi:hypothetical protein